MTAQCVRKHFYFTGRVQGVFFRATSQEFARRHGVVGWVRNLPDGRVEMEAEAAPATLAAFVQDVTQHFAANITAQDAESQPLRNDEDTFEVR